MILPPERQPLSTEIKMLDGIFVKSMIVQKAGDMVPQHAHTYSHVSALVRGSVRAWCDGVLMGDFHAPCGITIEARKKHAFLALEDGTAILCVHDIGTAEDVSIEDEHHLSEEV